MSPYKDIKFPPLTPLYKQRLPYDHDAANKTFHTSEKGEKEEDADVVSDQTSAMTKEKLCWTGSSYIYASSQRKPQLLLYLESYVKTELQRISPDEPSYQELKLQVYRKVFGFFIKEFRTYQPLLSAIKKEYENTLEYQHDKIHKLEPLRSHLSLVTEECDRKIQARWKEEQAEIRALKRQNQQMQRGIEVMREKEKAMQAVVNHLQSELSKQYLQYREERDACKLLIWQLNDQKRSLVKKEDAVYQDTEENKDPVELQLILKVCREDLTKAQEELTRIKAEYWDVVPRRSWDTLEQTHKQTLLQLKTLQGDFNQLKSEYDTLLELHKKESKQAEIHDSTSEQMGESLSQGKQPIQSSQLKEPINADDSGMLIAQELRTVSRASLPLKLDDEIDELAASAQSEPENSSDTSDTQRLHSLQQLPEFSAAASPSALHEPEENAAPHDLLASN